MRGASVREAKVTVRCRASLRGEKAGSRSGGGARGGASRGALLLAGAGQRLAARAAGGGPWGHRRLRRLPGGLATGRGGPVVVARDGGLTGDGRAAGDGRGGRARGRHGARLRTVRGAGTPGGFGLPLPAPGRMAARHDRARLEPAGLPAALLGVDAVLYLPCDALLHRDGPVSELLGRARGVPRRTTNRVTSGGDAWALRPTRPCSDASSRSPGSPKATGSSRWTPNDTCGPAACGCDGPARRRSAWSRTVSSPRGFWPSRGATSSGPCITLCSPTRRRRRVWYAPGLAARRCVRRSKGPDQRRRSSRPEEAA